MTKNKTLFSFLSKYYKGKKKALTLLLFISLILVGLQITLPQIIRKFIDTLTESKNVENTAVYGLTFLLISVLIAGFQIGVKYLSENLGWESTNLIRTELYKHVMELDEDFHSKHSPGELVEKIDGDVSNLQEFFSDFLVKIISSSILLIGILIILFLENIYVGLVLTSFTLIAMVSVNKIRSFAVPYWVKLRELKTKFFGGVTETYEGLDTLRVNGFQMLGYKIFKRNMIGWLPTRLKAQLASITLWMSILFIFNIGLLLSLGTGTLLFYNGAISIGTLYMIYNYTELLRKPIEEIRVQINTLQKAEASVIRINEILSLTPIVPQKSVHFDNKEEVTIELRKVSFSYDNKNQILNETDVIFRPNEAVALIGDTGSGKSTVVKLLMNLRKPTSGSILFNNIHVDIIDRVDLKELISYVPQDVKLFNGTIKDNITLYKPASDQEIENVFKVLNLEDFYNSLPNGIYTEVGTSGTNLSEGEKQLIALCRIYVRDSSVVILDEISSQIDEQTQEQIQQALNFFFKHKTVVIIAHKLETLKHVTHVYKLENGSLNSVEIENDNSSIKYLQKTH